MRWNRVRISTGGARAHSLSAPLPRPEMPARDGASAAGLDRARHRGDLLVVLRLGVGAGGGVARVGGAFLQQGDHGVLVGLLGFGEQALRLVVVAGGLGPSACSARVRAASCLPPVPSV